MEKTYCKKGEVRWRGFKYELLDLTFRENSASCMFMSHGNWKFTNNDVIKELCMSSLTLVRDHYFYYKAWQKGVCKTCSEGDFDTICNEACGVNSLCNKQ